MATHSSRGQFRKKFLRTFLDLGVVSKILGCGLLLGLLSLGILTAADTLNYLKVILSF